MTTEVVPPEWFLSSLANTPTDGWVTSKGCDIHYLAWGPIGAPGLVFIHGGAAHAHWWSHLVPMLATTNRVVAVDLSGHGDSGRRPQYRLEDWTSDVMAAAEHGQVGDCPVIIGHSMGGFVTVATAAAYGDALGGAIILDSPVTHPDPEVEAARGGKIFGPLRTYATADEAMARFRTVPEQDNYLPFVMEHVARTSIRENNGGWTWKYDPEIFVPFRSEARELLPQVSCRVALFRSEYGLVTPDIGEMMYELLGRVSPVVEIPLAGHHMMLDQPLMMLMGLRTILADWEHSRPLPRPAS